MHVTFGWIHLVSLAGAVQGFLLAGVLVIHRSNRTANRLLAALMAAFTVYLLEAIYNSTGMVRDYPHLFGIAYPLPWLFGPLVYLYSLEASDRSRRFMARDALHFVPAVAIVLIGLPIYMMSGPEKIALFERLRVHDAPLIIRLADPTKYASGVAYSIATVALLRRHRRCVEDCYSSTERVNLLWLLRLAGAVAAIWFLSIVVPIRYGDDVVALAMAVLVYAIGYMGLRQPEIFHFERLAAPDESAATSAEPPDVRDVPDVRDIRYERSGLGDAEAVALKDALLALMKKETLWRDPDLTLPDLAARLDTTPHKLSEVLNSQLGQTFYEFVNGHRVDDVRKRMARGDSNHLKVLALAMDAGFASKSTFNDVFKKRTGQTPSAYRRALAG